jgi:propanol-preferring alcohol dehydrogenase
MVLKSLRSPLFLEEVANATPNKGEVLIRVHACGVCRTDLHIADGDLPEPRLPLILGHQIVGTVVNATSRFKAGERIGVPWLGSTCGSCPHCKASAENLCDNAAFTGYTQNGGFAEMAVANENYCLKLPDNLDDLHVAPLLCAGLIGYRSYKLTGNAQTIGLYGFGNAAHILAQIAKHQGKTVYAFTRPGDTQTQTFARSLQCDWAGGSDETPPTPLDAALIFAPVGALIPTALKTVKKGGRVISAGIHMSDIPSFPYSLLWGERSVSSVANLTRADGEEFFSLIQEFPIKTHVTAYPLEEANEALNAIRTGTLEGAAVLII